MEKGPSNWRRKNFIPKPNPLEPKMSQSVLIYVPRLADHFIGFYHFEQEKWFEFSFVYDLGRYEHQWRYLNAEHDLPKCVNYQEYLNQIKVNDG